MIDYSLASKLKASYRKAYPFPHTIIDNFITDEQILRKSVEELKNYKEWGRDKSQGDMEIEKFQTPWNEENIYSLEKECPITFFLLNYFNSTPVLNFLSELTGIPDLIADNTFYGAGVHKIKKGGRLAVHADYSYHRYTKKHRRINLLIYLNEQWMDHWRGNLEFWEKDMSKCIKQIEPLFNRATIFNITNIALHGHPEALNCPEDLARYSFAFYYFTETRPQEEIELNSREGDQSTVLWKEFPEESVMRKKGIVPEEPKEELKISMDNIFKF